MKVTIIGAGLAGAEAAWQLAQRGIAVQLVEMRPQQMTPAHKTGDFAELVCSNSLRSDAIENAVGLLKEELRQLGSLIMEVADQNRVPAGGALAVDRHKFALTITQRLLEHPLIDVVREEVTSIPTEGIVIIASGPLTSSALSQAIGELTGTDYLYFYDAAAPIVDADSVDKSIAFWASRYDKGDADYLNCPMTEEEYNRFYEALTTAEVHPLKEFEKEIFFEGCMPIEVMARRGRETMTFGPLKPVGLRDPRTEKRPFAVVQLRKENLEGTMLNLVGFQTHLKWPEQKRVFSLIPGLGNAEFIRYGVMHRNTFINSPLLLAPTYQMKKQSRIFFAGQITGVEGYIESTSSGFLAGLNAARLVKGWEPLIFPAETAMGALANYITTADAKNFQPMNVNYGIFPSLPGKVKGKSMRQKAHSERALSKILEMKSQNF
ncbi:FADH(2)-oxidizing methylenetetrahydrofolate--tRNA-(uracil(54)-C(5))-methyltransferase TrmFO [Heliorestis acidaminivorans]|uniref:Methylenetetrahydrofolate--tRNA-(uracil-5-)-methyltransferase TrmFO n=1 Tax=Heliorestis acidaminivorans TaxID=553427 RepID=A0A6I0EUG2_9FIRM|nr:FADH(2)-oxidizing methylenetetrahydrofolate--tRNA-(uracil(54)-C(5))-methyltransferase TrmFO [Heliorestis acidaminivorans]KAB2954405.1 FADH(2)-oxidizing methylenetetrahydrofolate--tRNA-(uracil(54)-C(5))-methyltransferase TrmFO [Heliorestis acidaminivorans]